MERQLLGKVFFDKIIYFGKDRKRFIHIVGFSIDEELANIDRLKIHYLVKFVMDDNHSAHPTKTMHSGWCLIDKKTLLEASKVFDAMRLYEDCLTFPTYKSGFGATLRHRSTYKKIELVTFDKIENLSFVVKRAPRIEALFSEALLASNPQGEST